MLHPLKKYGFPIILVVIAGIFIFWNNNDSNHAAVEKDPDAADSAKETEAPGDTGTIDAPTKVMVDVKGEVTEPGVYEAKTDARVHDVIQMAGGFTKMLTRQPLIWLKKSRMRWSLWCRMMRKTQTHLQQHLGQERRKCGLIMQTRPR